jgi:hypothetical protein
MQWSKTPPTPCSVGTPVQEMLSSWYIQSSSLTTPLFVPFVVTPLLARPLAVKVSLSLVWDGPVGRGVPVLDTAAVDWPS